MQLIKHAHSCVSLVKDGRRIVLDPGNVTPDAASAVAAAEAVLITHEHPDHFDEDLLAQALDARPELRVYAPASVAGRWPARRGQVTAVAAGDRFSIAGFDIEVSGGQHALIHRDIPAIANVGYLIEDRLYHPGDSYTVPPAPVETLLLPIAGAWTKHSEAVDYVRVMRPGHLVQIHEGMLNDPGQRALARYLSPEMLTEVTLSIVPIGDAITV